MSGYGEAHRVEVEPVDEGDKAVLANLVQFYRYDFSEIRHYDLTPHGTYVYRFLDQCFVEPGREACFIRDGGLLAGFGITRRLADGTREMSEFFVLRRHRRKGVGRAAAHKLFQRHPGAWTLAFDHANEGAVLFWPRVVAAAARGPMRAEDRRPPEVTYPGTILRFEVAPLGPTTPV